MQTVQTNKAPLINKQEAAGIFKVLDLSDLNTAKDLYDIFEETEHYTADGFWHLWHLMSMLSFAYAVGRAQGVRNERAKRKGLRV